MPVRHGKSFLGSFLLPAWFSMTFPEKSTILATHTADLSSEFGHRVRQLVDVYGPTLTGVSLDRHFKARDHFVTSHGGHFRTSSPGSSVAGKGAHLLIGDDLVRDAQDAASPSRRRSLATWWHSEAMTRLEPGGKVVLIMSRRHPDDLSGSLLAMNDELAPQDRWHVVRFKAIGDDGAALWPERYPVEKLHDIKRNLELAGQSYLWNCLYQQDPISDALSLEWPSSYFEGILYDEHPPQAAIRWRVLAIDPSKGSNAKAGDYAGIMDVRVTHDLHLWITPYLRRLTTTQIEDTVIGLCRQNTYHAVICEANAFQSVLAENIVKRGAALGLSVPMHVITNSSDKHVRIRLSLTPLLHQKRIHVWAGSSSARLMVSQLSEFPSGAHDDGPDSLELATQLINEMLAGRGVKR